MDYSQPGPSRASGGFVYFSNDSDQNNDFIPFDSSAPSTSRGPSTPTPNDPEPTFKSPTTPQYNPPSSGYTDYHSPNTTHFSPTHCSSPYDGANKRKYPSPNWQQNKRGGNWGGTQNRGRGRQSGHPGNFNNRSGGQGDNWGGQNRSRGRGNRNFPQQKPPIVKYFHPTMLENPWAKLERAHAYEQKVRKEAQSAAST